jgi:hypothetical protein
MFFSSQKKNLPVTLIYLDAYGIFMIAMIFVFNFSFLLNNNE